jgi:hypothetical protein
MREDGATLEEGEREEEEEEEGGEDDRCRGDCAAIPRPLPYLK